MEKRGDVSVRIRAYSATEKTGKSETRVLALVLELPTSHGERGRCECRVSVRAYLAMEKSGMFSTSGTTLG